MKRKFDNKYIYMGVTAFCVLVAVLIFGFVFFNIDTVWAGVQRLNSALMPVYIGLVIAYLLSPLVNAVERNLFIPLFRKVTKKRKTVRGVSRAVSVAVVLIIAIAVIFWLTMLVVPEVVDSITNLANSLPGYYRKIVAMAQDISVKHPEIAKYMMEITGSVYNQLINWMQNELIPTSTEILGVLSDGLINALGVMLNVVIGIIISIYLMASKELFCAQAKRMLFSILPVRYASRVLGLGKDINRSFAKFFSGKIIDSIIVAIITFIVLSIAGIPYTALISVLIGVTNVIPFFGQYIGAIPSALLVFIVSPVKGFIFVVLIIIILQVDGNVIGPKIIGESIGLGSFWILFAILVFGSLFGIIGMICAVPVFAVVYKTVRNWSKERLKKKGLPSETVSYKRIEYILEKKK
ncbi:MAG: AI-2E family transporter [Roseburia sp.]|nr:AI-2E family transporter [Roseburia sp.]